MAPSLRGRQSLRLVYILAHEKGGGLKLCPRIDLCFLGPPVALLTSCRLPPLG